MEDAATVLAVLLVKVRLDDGLDDAERVIGALVKVGADLLEDVVRDVVEWIRCDDVCGVEWGGNASEVGVHGGEAGSGRKDKGVAFFLRDLSRGRRRAYLRA